MIDPRHPGGLKTSASAGLRRRESTGRTIAIPAISQRALYYQVKYRNASKDRKSTRLNSSHLATSYAVLCLKKKGRSGSSSRLATSLPWASDFRHPLHGRVRFFFNDTATTEIYTLSLPAALTI